jgi:Zn-dependent protease
MPRRRGLVAALAATTFLTVTASGTTHGALYDFVRTGQAPSLWTLHSLGMGLSFALGLLGPLTLHELGHILAYRRYGMSWRGPFAVPLPLLLTGTLGSFIRLDSPYPSRRAMVVSGAAGPLAGLAGIVPAAWLGLRWSIHAGLANGTNLKRFGMPWLLSAMGRGHSYVLHPLAAGAWLAALFTFVNLLPFDHFDGGTIVRGLHGPTARMLSVVMLGVAFWLSAFSLTWSAVFAVEILVMIVAGLQDDPLEREPLTWSASLWAAGAALALALTWVRLI